MPAAIMSDDLYPPNPWPVPTHVIQPTISVHDGLQIDPALIRIAQDYGWMRAWDVLMVSDVQALSDAMATSDAITQKRMQIQDIESNAWLFIEKNGPDQLRSVLSYWGKVARPYKDELAGLVADRKSKGFGMPDGAGTWALRWEYPEYAKLLGIAGPQDL
jgi:hypothetical protein